MRPRQGAVPSAPMLRVTPLPGNRQRLDGGAMFGNAPRALWSRWCTPDADHRIELACRSVLVEDGERRLLLETGIGAFFEPHLRERYGVTDEGHRLIDSLGAIGLGPRDIDVILLSHLHFDHAGGLLAPYRPGEGAALLFPRARIVVGRTALERARAPHRRDRASYVPGLVELLEASRRLDVVEEGESTHPALGPRVELSRSDGHTPGLLHAEVRGAAGWLVYASDLVPGVPWTHVPITMGYDRAAEQVVEEKRDLLARVAAGRGLVAFTHDARIALAGIEPDGRGSFRTVGERTDGDGPLDLDAAV